MKINNDKNGHISLSKRLKELMPKSKYKEIMQDYELKSVYFEHKILGGVYSQSTLIKFLQEQFESEEIYELENQKLPKSYSTHTLERINKMIKTELHNYDDPLYRGSFLILTASKKNNERLPYKNILNNYYNRIEFMKLKEGLEPILE